MSKKKKGNIYTDFWNFERRAREEQIIDLLPDDKGILTKLFRRYNMNDKGYLPIQIMPTELTKKAKDLGYDIKVVRTKDGKSHIVYYKGKTFKPVLGI